MYLHPNADVCYVIIGHDLCVSLTPTSGNAEDLSQYDTGCWHGMKYCNEISLTNGEFLLKQFLCYILLSNREHKGEPFHRTLYLSKVPLLAVNLQFLQETTQQFSVEYYSCSLHKHQHLPEIDNFIFII